MTEDTEETRAKVDAETEACAQVALARIPARMEDDLDFWKRDICRGIAKDIRARLNPLTATERNCPKCRCRTVQK